MSRSHSQNLGMSDSQTPLKIELWIYVLQNFKYMLKLSFQERTTQKQNSSGPRKFTRPNLKIRSNKFCESLKQILIGTDMLHLSALIKLNWINLLFSLFHPLFPQSPLWYKYTSAKYWPGSSFYAKCAETSRAWPAMRVAADILLPFSLLYDVYSRTTRVVQQAWSMETGLRRCT